MNLLINGGFEYSQANENALITINNSSTKTHLCDGVVSDFTSANGGVVKAQQVTDAPIGARQSMKFSVTTSAALSVTDKLVFSMPFGADQIQDLMYGTASAVTTSIGIWVKSSITGTFAVSIRTPNGSRAIVENITVSAANTWEYKTINGIVGETSGTWANSGVGLAGYISVAVVSGSNFNTAAANTWANGLVYASTSQTNTHISTVNSTFQIALPNWTVSATAQTFVTDPHELARVQRRFQKSYDLGTAIGTATYAGAECVYEQDLGALGYSHSKSFRFTMASTPTVTFYSELTGATGNVGDISSVTDRAITPIAGSQNGFNLAVFNIPAGDFTMYHWTADARLI